jgi:hypothetical protein
MACARCNDDRPTGPRSWCGACEGAYDTWVRRHASDIIWPVMAGMVIVSVGGLALPLLGASTLIAVAGVFAGFGSIVGLSRLSSRRRRRQFALASLPRAYLPGKTSAP